MKNPPQFSTKNHLLKFFALIKKHSVYARIIIRNGVILIVSGRLNSSGRHALNSRFMDRQRERSYSYTARCNCYYCRLTYMYTRGGGGE